MQNHQLPRRWFQWAIGMLLIAAGCVQPLATALAEPQIPLGEARIWFYRGYEPPVGYSPLLIPTIAANATYVAPTPSWSVFHRDVPAGHWTRPENWFWPVYYQRNNTFCAD